ncbi:MAG TPA: carboxylating nicotinate-nucleotide diphosphorylase, partial [Chromatiales bacterium]|nr:carboxylating nicotinate-nucleotide diphosphorylase [Chromatiales bacterium]
MELTPAEIAVAKDRVRDAIAEDLGSGDLTAALVPAGQRADARIIVREDAVLCGQFWVDEVFRQIDPAVTIDWQVADGDGLSAGGTVCELHGPARGLLTGERTALNFLQALSGTATLTRRYVDAVSGTGVTLLDTRKTVPGLRLAQKYAVRCGGASNHRIGLFDAILIKENHIAAAGSIAAAVDAAAGSDVLIEIEVENLDQLREALQTPAQRLLLDNFSLDQLREAVRLRDGLTGSDPIPAGA